MDLIVFHIWPRTTTYGLDSVSYLDLIVYPRTTTYGLDSVSYLAPRTTTYGLDSESYVASNYHIWT